MPWLVMGYCTFGNTQTTLDWFAAFAASTSLRPSVLGFTITLGQLWHWPDPLHSTSRACLGPWCDTETLEEDSCLIENRWVVCPRTDCLGFTPDDADR